jgi:hypothetical protein
MYSKRAKQGTKKDAAAFFVFYKLPSLFSADSRSSCLHISLGCKPGRSYGLFWADSTVQNNVRKDDPSQAYSPVSDRGILTALVDVHWTQRVQAPMPQISGSAGEPRN